MNLFEARKSGKWYRSPCWLSGLYERLIDGKTEFKSKSTIVGESTVLPYTDIDADDYILEPDDPVIKNVKVYAAIRKISHGHYHISESWFTTEPRLIGDFVGFEEREIEVTE